MMNKGRGQKEIKMPKNHCTERGQALTELALTLPILLLLFLGVAEVGNAMNAYLTIAEASRDGARLVLRQGDAADVKGLVETLTERLPPSQLAVKISKDRDSSGGPMVTVEVQYDYKLLFGTLPFSRATSSKTFQLKAKTTMPIP